ncbi:hypothetical protein EDB80DRAFT_714937 [Ilyonectria destructans]|nr:hypothetical protein EDB80DRAFT_714937 [Ilyonectria destructans]
MNRDTSPPHSMDQCAYPNDSQERKKLRNRLSQQAFRRRQAESIRELRSLVDANQRPDNERIEALQRENSVLRAQLVDVQNKMSRLLATVQSMSESVSKTLDEAASMSKENEKGSPEPQESCFETPESFLSPSCWLTADETFAPEPLDSGASAHKSPAPMTVSLQDIELHTGPNLSIVEAGPLYEQIPKIWDFGYQMGPQSYMNAISSSEKSMAILGKRWAPSNSPFSDHINVLQLFLKDKLNRTGLITSPQSLARSLYQPILMALSMFNSMARPHMMDWYAKTRYFHTIDLTAWQIYPSLSTFGRLHERFRPTDIQATNQHPRAIDWIAFPSVRDRLIQLHAANPQIDQIFCDVVNSYVVEAKMSDLIQGAPALDVYVRVTDLVSGMSSLDEIENDLDKTLPAPDAASLFTVGKYARAAFRYLNMDRGPSFYKVDPSLFGKYPELYDHNVDIMAAGIPLKPDLQLTLTPPKPLDFPTAETYYSFIDFYLDSIDSF